MCEKITKRRIYLDFTDKDLANDMWKFLKSKQVGFTMTAEEVKEEAFPIVYVAFDNSNKTYTYRLSEAYAQILKENKEARKRNWPTRYGPSYGISSEPTWMTKEEINKIYPFDQIVLVSKPENNKPRITAPQNDLDDWDYISDGALAALCKYGFL